MDKSLNPSALAGLTALATIGWGEDWRNMRSEPVYVYQKPPHSKASRNKRKAQRQARRRNRR